MNYTGTVSIRIHSLSTVCQTEEVPLKFDEEDFVFIAEKARKGILEKICIKKINVSATLLNYVDTFNEVYLEDELVSEEDATQLAITYFQRRIVRLEADLDKNSTAEKEKEVEECQDALIGLQSKTDFIEVNPSYAEVTIICF